MLFNLDGKMVDCPVLLTEKQIQKMVWKIAKKISRDHAGESIVLVAVERGGIPFAGDLMHDILKIGRVRKVLMDSVKVSSYAGTESTGRLVWEKELSNPRQYVGMHLIVVEDIVDRGLTIMDVMRRLREYLREDIKSVKCAALLDKPARRLPGHQGFKPDYLGYTLRGEPYVAGYGLDYNQLLRDTRCIVEIPEYVYRNVRP